MHTRTVEVKFDPAGDDRQGCLWIDNELFSWHDENLIIHIREKLQRKRATRIRKIGDTSVDGEVVTVNEFLREIEVVSNGFR